MCLCVYDWRPLNTESAVLTGSATRATGIAGNCAERIARLLPHGKGLTCYLISAHFPLYSHCVLSVNDSGSDSREHRLSTYFNSTLNLKRIILTELESKLVRLNSNRFLTWGSLLWQEDQQLLWWLTSHRVFSYHRHKMFILKWRKQLNCCKVHFTGEAWCRNVRHNQTVS